MILTEETNREIRAQRSQQVPQGHWVSERRARLPMFHEVLQWQNHIASGKKLAGLGRLVLPIVDKDSSGPGVLLFRRVGPSVQSFPQCSTRPHSHHSSGRHSISATLSGQQEGTFDPAHVMSQISHPPTGCPHLMWISTNPWVLSSPWSQIPTRSAHRSNDFIPGWREIFVVPNLSYVPGKRNQIRYPMFYLCGTNSRHMWNDLVECVNLFFISCKKSHKNTKEGFLLLSFLMLKL